MADPNWSDPCAVYEWGSAILPKLLAGQATVRTSHGDTSVEYSAGNAREFATYLRQKYSECQAATGGTRRRAIVMG